jgi:hypothetical protein
MSKQPRNCSSQRRRESAADCLVFDIFEVLPGGSPLWRGIIEGAGNVTAKLTELAAGTNKEFFAFHFQTGEIVARINSGRCSLNASLVHMRKPMLSKANRRPHPDQLRCFPVSTES